MVNIEELRNIEMRLIVSMLSDKGVKIVWLELTANCCIMD